MGKAKRIKMRNKSTTPTGLQSVKDAESSAAQGQTDNVGVSSRVSNLVESLQSPSAEERECCCSTIAYLVGSDTGSDTIDHFLRAGIVKVLGPLLMDASLGVRKVALGVLRNMSVVGGTSTCVTMVTQDVMTPLVALLHTFSGRWPSATSSTTDTANIEVYQEAVHLLWNLCESSSTAVTIINQQSVIPILLPTLLPCNCGYPIAIATAQCLYTLTEDNAEGASVLGQHDALGGMKGLLCASPDRQDTPDSNTSAQLNDSEQLLLRVLVAGVLYNVSCSQSAGLGGAVIQNVISLLVDILQCDITESLQRLSQFPAILQSCHDDEDPGVAGAVEAEILAADIVAPSGECSDDESLEGSVENGLNGESEPDMDDRLEPTQHLELDRLLADVQRIINAQQIAMEMTANLCCTADEEGDWEDIDGSDSSSDDLSAEVMECTEVMEVTEGQNGDTDTDCLCLSGEVQKAVVTSGLVQKVFERLKPLEDTLRKGLDAHEKTKLLNNSLGSLQERALLCFGNLVAALEVDDLGGSQLLHDVWRSLLSLVSTTSADTNLDLLEAATSALRAMSDKLQELDTPQLAQVTDMDLSFLYKMGQSCKHPAVRVNTTQIVSSLALQLVDVDNFTLVKSAGDYLCSVVTNDDDLWVVAEALDAIFDVFAEDKTDDVVKEIGLVAKLRELVPTLKQKVRQQKRHLGEHYAVISTAKTNLARFIKYKMGRPAAT